MQSRFVQIVAAACISLALFWLVAYLFSDVALWIIRQMGHPHRAALVLIFLPFWTMFIATPPIVAARKKRAPCRHPADTALRLQ